MLFPVYSAFIKKQKSPAECAGLKAPILDSENRTMQHKNKKALQNVQDFSGDPSGIRTRDTLIKSQVLYRLS